MPRIRTIKPEFPQSESMGRISRDSRLTFIQLWTLADDSGRLRGSSRMLASLLFPYDDDAPGLIDGWLGELERENCIVRYFGNDGSAYIEILNWCEHQKIDKPSESKLPAPDSSVGRECSRGFARIREPSIPSRARADQGPRTKERTKDQGPGEELATSSPIANTTSVQKHPPSVDAVRAYMADQGYPDDAVAFVDFYTANGWVQGRGKPIRDWQASVRTWQRNGFGTSAGARSPVTFAKQREVNMQVAGDQFVAEAKE